MNKLLRYWNKNKGKILITISVIAFLIISFRVADSLIRIQNENKAETPKYNRVKDIKNPTESVISGEKVKQNISTQNSEIIKQFVNYCNNKEIKKAYELLSEDCKMEFGNDINKFTNNYYKKVFNTNKNYTLELWLNESNSYTYKILYCTEDLLASGGNTSNNIEDLITVIRQDDSYKLNVGGFIKKETINKSAISNDIEIIVNSKKVYRSYEKYNISIKNNTKKTILISDSKSDKDICLLDKNDIEYASYVTQMPITNLYVSPGQNLNINIKFNKIYDLTRIIKSMKFEKIILDANSKDINNEKIESITMTISM